MGKGEDIVAAVSTRQRVAWLCASMMFIVVVASAFLRHHANADPMATQIGIESARLLHRVAATLVLLGAVVLVVLARRIGNRAVLGLPSALLATALLLSVLGIAAGPSRAIPVVLLNLFGGFAMLALCLRLAWPPEAGEWSSLRRAARWLLALGIAQAAAGAWAGSDALAECIGLEVCAWPGIVHRFTGMAFGYGVLLFGTIAIWRGYKTSRALVAIILLAMALGMASSGTGAVPAPELIVLHNALAAAALAILARIV